MADTSNNGWKCVHEQLVSLARRRAALDLDEAHWLLRGLRTRVHTHLGYGSYREYLERLFGYTPREVAERLRVARALEDLPSIAEALGDGTRCWSAVRELTRVAVGDTEQAWIEATEGRSVREIEEMVSGRQPGDLPSDPPDARARRHVLRFEVTAEEYAAWREAVAELRRQAGGELDEDEAFVMVARMVLAGSKDEGRANYQVAMKVCERCGQGWQQGRGEEIAVDDAVVEMAECDAQHVDTTHVGSRARQRVPPRTRRLVMRRDHGQCVVPGCRAATFVDVHHLKLRSEGGDDDPKLLVTLCGAHHMRVHRGTLIIDGDVEQGLRFHHADGTRYGLPLVDPTLAQVSTKAFGELRHMGFREEDAKRALAQVRTHVGAEPSVEVMLRAALGVLT